MKLNSYRISTIEGEETIYDADLSIISDLLRLRLYRNDKFTGKEFMYPFSSVYKIETINKENQVSDGAIIISNDNFKQFSRAIEAYDDYLKGDNDDFFDPAS